MGEDAKPIQVRMELKEGRAIWSIEDVPKTKEERIIDLLKLGMSVRDIAEEVGLSNFSD